jgi:hypothetical protein
VASTFQNVSPGERREFVVHLSQLNKNNENYVMLSDFAKFQSNENNASNDRVHFPTSAPCMLLS